MNKWLTAAGIFLTLIWWGVLFISFGLPISICQALKSIAPAMFSKAIDNLHHGFYYEVSNKDMPSAVFFVLFSAAFFIYFAICKKTEKSSADKKTFGLVILFSVLFRLILWPSVAIHESDFYRYLWDGKSFQHGVNPFKYAPAQVKLAQDVNSPELAVLNNLRGENPILIDRINHSGIATIYPPVAQLIFALSSYLREDSILVLKATFIFFDLLVLGTLALLLRHFKKNPAMCIIYGWSPLVLKEIANSGHYDSIAIFLVLLAFYFMFKDKLLSGTISLALASLTKFFPLLLLPIFRKKINRLYLLTFGMIIVAMYIPFFIWNHTGIFQVFSGFGVYFKTWAYNGSVFVLMQALFDIFPLKSISSFQLAKLATTGMFLLVWLRLILQKQDGQIDLLKRTFIVLVTLFLLNPVGEPWYFCWAIPFLSFFPYRSFLFLSWLLIFSYLSFSKDWGMFAAGVFKVPVLNAIQYVPFLALFLWECVIKKKVAVNYVEAK